MKTITFGKDKSGNDAIAYTLTCGDKRATVLRRGAVLQSLVIGGTDVVLGYDTQEGYEVSDGYLGALVGRYANRIRDGRFVLDGKAYQLARNENGTTHLHGGNCGFDSRLWDAQDAAGDGFDAVRLTLTSPDGEEGYPGCVTVAVTYLLDDGGLMIRYEAQTDRATPLNLTNHAYFNLNGGGDISAHRLTVVADAYSPVDQMLIPVDPAAPVAGTALDFRTEKTLGEALAADEPQYAFTGGVDHNFVLSGTETRVYRGATLRRAAVLRGQALTMTLDTDFPCVQVYTANFLGGDYPLKGKVQKTPRTAVCLETQTAAADGPNRGEGILHPGETYYKTACFSFSAQ